MFLQAKFLPYALIASAICLFFGCKGKQDIVQSSTWSIQQDSLQWRFDQVFDQYPAHQQIGDDIKPSILYLEREPYPGFYALLGKMGAQADAITKIAFTADSAAKTENRSLAVWQPIWQSSKMAYGAYLQSEKEYKALLKKHDIHFITFSDYYYKYSEQHDAMMDTLVQFSNRVALSKLYQQTLTDESVREGIQHGVSECNKLVKQTESTLLTMYNGISRYEFARPEIRIYFGPYIGGNTDVQKVLKDAKTAASNLKKLRPMVNALPLN